MNTAVQSEIKENTYINVVLRGHSLSKHAWTVYLKGTSHVMW